MIVEIKQLLLQRTDNQPNALFPGGLADFITVHMTGNRSAGADAASHARWMYDNAPYSWHATVDDVEAWQQLPWKAQGWHAGDAAGPGNTRSIGIEICMHAGIDQIRAYENAAWIVAMLLRLGHGAKGVVQHNYWTGKNCPELIRAEAGRWEWFLDRVRAYGVEEDDMADPRVDDIVKFLGDYKAWLANGNIPLIDAFAAEQVKLGTVTHEFGNHVANHGVGTVPGAVYSDIGRAMEQAAKAITAAGNARQA